jgi:hypothetical protein
MRRRPTTANQATGTESYFPGSIAVQQAAISEATTLTWNSGWIANVTATPAAFDLTGREIAYVFIQSKEGVTEVRLDGLPFGQELREGESVTFQLIQQDVVITLVPVYGTSTFYAEVGFVP